MVSFSSKDLLKEQIEQISESTRAKEIRPAVRVGMSYNVALQKIVKEVNNDVVTHIIPLTVRSFPEYKADSEMVLDGWADDIIREFERISVKWESEAFKTLSNKIAAEFVRSADQVNEARFNEAYKFGIDIFSGNEELQQYLLASAYDNSQLIQSIPTQYLTNVQSSVMTNMRAGLRSSNIIKDISAQYKVTKRRARFIARDQTAKINGDLTARRQQAVGFEYFQWIYSNDQRVRTRHRQIADKVTAYGPGVYRWDDPPISEDGTAIIPGSDYGCRCIAKPISQKQVDKFKSEGKTA